jgi:diguanylate cyclase (GGDEF)-like protein
VLCGDIEINEIYGAAQKYALSAALISVVFFAVSLLFVNLWIGKRIVRPIQKLQDAAGAFEDKCRRRADVEELVMRDPEIHTKDEIEGLSASIVSMVQDVQGYAKDLLRKEEEIRRKETEILSMKEYVSQMDELAYRDILTGAGNKAAYEKAARKLDWNILVGTADFAIVMGDLNYLKRINDSYGHDKGNVYIKRMYDMLAEMFTESPIFRIGGDEFVVIVQDRELECCEKMVDSLRERMEKTMRDGGLEPWERISTAFGIGRYAVGDDVNAVFKKADIAMYDEKKRMHAER